MTTTVTDSGIGEQLRALIRLQHVDSRIDQLEQMRGDLPHEIRDLEDEEKGLQTRVENLKQEEKEHEVGSRQAELTIKESEGLIKKYEEQQLQVRNNREYDALTKEIEAQKQRIQDGNQQIQNITESKEPRALATQEAELRLKELKEVLKAKRDELSEVMSDTEAEQKELQSRRDKAEEAVDKRYLRAYSRLRSRVKDGRALVPLVRGAASGYAVPPQRQVEIRQRNRIVACEHTGRIIVDSELFAETTTELDKELG
ncbi:MAG: zinc ribbon domain-containing protein [Rhodothermales bacterium]